MPILDVVYFASCSADQTPQRPASGAGAARRLAVNLERAGHMLKSLVTVSTAILLVSAGVGCKTYAEKDKLIRRRGGVGSLGVRE